MISRRAKIVIAAACVAAIPLVLQRLMWATPNIGLVWLLPHQLYYVPLSWLGEPFFVRDSDVGFLVQWPGRVLAAFVYVLGVLAVSYGLSHARQSRTKSQSRSRVLTDDVPSG